MQELNELIQLSVAATIFSIVGAGCLISLWEDIKKKRDLR